MIFKLIVKIYNATNKQTIKIIIFNPTYFILKLIFLLPSKIF
jgi:hypothetical protein